MSIIPLTPKDCAFAARLHQKAFYKGWTEEDFQEFLRNPLVFGLKIQGLEDISAYILWREVEDEAEILTLVVAPSYQRKGLGNLLLGALFEQLKAKGISKLFLEVAEDNETGQLFYIKNGFSLIGKRPNYYERPGHTFVDGLNFCKVMRK